MSDEDDLQMPDIIDEQHDLELIGVVTDVVGAVAPVGTAAAPCVRLQMMVSEVGKHQDMTLGLNVVVTQDLNSTLLEAIEDSTYKAVEAAKNYSKGMNEIDQIEDLLRSVDNDPEQE